jgi:hypothetical protein
VDTAGAREMLRELRAFPLLDGYRNAPYRDVEGACDAIAAFGRSFVALGDAAAEAEINPLAVHERGQGVAMLDALVLPAAR